jgi:hypothetical protein
MALHATERELVEFVDLEATGIVQALRMAAQDNAASAVRLAADDPASAQLMRDSAAAWTAKADRLERLVDALPS